MRFYIYILFLCSATVIYGQNNLPLIPKPVSLDMASGYFLLDSKAKIETIHSESFEATYLQKSIEEQTGLHLEITKQNSKKAIVLELKNTQVFKNDEGYELKIGLDRIVISSASTKGLFYGIQTLLQVIPYEQNSKIKLPFLTITDKPKFQWRGMHLDVCRHFFPVDFIKKYIDFLAMYKMNRFHWHLTDDQGWRIEIKKYPKLQEIAAWRNGSMVGHYTDQKYDTLRYGGYYTQEEVAEIVTYASQRHITVIPEIEMPGHAQAALAAYPELSCTGGLFEVAKEWGVLDDVFCPKEETFTFLENVLTEVMALFPSKIIHIGGDECPKTRWKNCEHCQKLMIVKGLKDEHELQSYFIQRIEKFLNSKGRNIIGWDEILEGGLAPNAAVMSWRGTQGGIDAAKAKHNVVMCPGSYCYFDYYQADPKNEPIAIGGYIPIEKVYSFNPIPKELTTEEEKYILGAQANLWTEYIATPEHVEYMVMPRMAALSEVVWGTSNTDEYKNFQNRLLQHFSIYKAKNINYSEAIFELDSKAEPTANGVNFILKGINPNNIHYTIDGTEPTLNSSVYKNPIIITKSGVVKAVYFENNIKKSNILEQEFFINKATGKKINLKYQPHENYSGDGAFSLVNGMQGNPTKYGRDWLGFLGTNLEVVIDLENQSTITNLGLNTLQSEGSWIYFPKKILFSASNDGVNYNVISEISQSEIQQNKGRIRIEIPETSARYIKVVAENNGAILDGKPGAGSKSWLFVDEIMIN